MIFEGKLITSPLNPLHMYLGIQNVRRSRLFDMTVAVTHAKCTGCHVLRIY